MKNYIQRFGFDKVAIREALGGNVEMIQAAFYFGDTPQGHNHWWDVSHGIKRLSKRSRQYLNKLLNS